MRLRIATVTWALMVTAVFANGCGGYPDRQRQADAVVAELRTGFGVESVHQNYVNSIDRGASFEVRTEVDRGIAAPALANVGRQFVELVDHGGFTDHLLSLSIAFPVAGPGSDQNNRSGAAFNFTDDAGKRLKDVTADQVAADLEFWINVVNFPGVTMVQLHRPAEQSARDGRDRSVYAHVADSAAGNALQNRYPELTNRWRT